MSNENEDLKPLSFENDNPLKPLTFGTQNEAANDFVPLAKATGSDIKNKDSNFVFFLHNV